MSVDIAILGDHIARLRLSREMKQTELAYEAGVSHRTLQRLEAGEAVRSDGLLRVIRTLGRLDAVMAALDAQALSPYELLANEGLSVGELRPEASLARGDRKRRRVRRAKSPTPADGASLQWPEDTE